MSMGGGPAFGSGGFFGGGGGYGTGGPYGAYPHCGCSSLFIILAGEPGDQRQRRAREDGPPTKAALPTAAALPGPAPCEIVAAAVAAMTAGEHALAQTTDEM